MGREVEAQQIEVKAAILMAAESVSTTFFLISCDGNHGLPTGFGTDPPGRRFDGPN